MRLWSLHPGYLDVKGLTALWREALLAQAVLGSNTRGYRRHPQLERFKAAPEPLTAIAVYLRAVHEEAAGRGYRFDASKIGPLTHCPRLTVTDGQRAFELAHLRAKLALRDKERLKALDSLTAPRLNPLFEIIPGPVETWERP